jgi:hypothetical protein
MLEACSIHGVKKTTQAIKRLVTESELGYLDADKKTKLKWVVRCNIIGCRLDSSDFGS